MVRHKDYRYMEHIMYSYKKDKEKLSGLNEDIRILDWHGDVKVQGYEPRYGSGGGVSDGVADLAHTRLMLEKKINRLLLRTFAVEKLRNGLYMNEYAEEQISRIMLEILEHVYIEQDADLDALAFGDRKVIHEVRVLLVKLMMKIYRELSMCYNTR